MNRPARRPVVEASAGSVAPGAAAALRAARALLLGAACLGGALLVLIALNRARFGDVVLTRWRETTLAVEAALLLAAALRPRPGPALAALARRIGQALASERLFAGLAALTTALFVAAALTQHAAFRTGSHDFSMIDEALWHSHHGRFLHSPVLGRSFLSEHFSPVLALLVPLHAVVPHPLLLVLVQPLALGASALVLRGLWRDLGASPAAAHLAALLYLHHAVMISTLNYLFHMECLLPLALFLMVRAYLARRWGAYALAGALALSIKEDVGLYLAGFGLFVAVADRRPGVGLATAAAGIAASWAAVRWAMPLAGAEGYAFLGRWSSWGEGPLGVLAGFARDPLRFLPAVLAPRYLEFLASILALPLLAPATLLLVAAPWAVSATSSLPAQSGLLLYYGIPLLGFAAVACGWALRSPRVARLFAGGRGPALVAAAVVLDVSHLSFPAIPPERSAMLRAIEALPPRAPAQLMWCFFPVAGYERPKTLLRPGEPLEAPYVILRAEGDTWPFSPAEARRVAEAAIATGRYRNLSEIPGFYILERLAGPAAAEVGGRAGPSRSDSRPSAPSASRSGAAP